MKPVIYLDNAASTMVAPEVVEAMQPFMTKWYGNPGSVHQFGRKAKEAVENARAIIARKINAQPEEIIFTSGGTESNNLAIKGAVVGQKEKKHIVTTTVEHPSVLNACRALESDGFPVSYISVNGYGVARFDEIEKAISKKTALVSVIHGNNEIGTVNDIAAVGKICAQKGAPFHVDACQSFLKERIDVEKMGIDLLTLNAHKVHGSKGVGALYVRKGVQLRPLFHGGEQEFGLRAGTENVAGIVGFGKAVELWKESDNEKMRVLRDHLILHLLKIKDSRLNGSREKRLCNNVNVSFKGVEGEAIVLHLDSHGVMASTGSACTSHRIEASHVLKAIGLSDEWALGSVRFGLSRYTTNEEVKMAAETTKEIVESLRAIM